jgi:predicted secreted protein
MPNRSIAAFALIAALFAGAGATVLAGDSASFVDLGFSADGTVYMFAQYGVDSESRKPWAELFTVDVPRNAFVPGAVKKSVGKAPVEAGQNGIGTFHALLAENAAIAKKYNVDHTREGTPLYVAIENGGGKAGEPIEFRDFDSGASYKTVWCPIQRARKRPCSLPSS